MILPVTTECRLCGRTHRISLITHITRGPYICPDEELSACLATYHAKHDAPPEVFDDPDMEPPHDLHECHVCRTTGQVLVRVDWESGAYITKPCPWCGGTGEEPVLGCNTRP